MTKTHLSYRDNFKLSRTGTHQRQTILHLTSVLSSMHDMCLDVGFRMISFSQLSMLQANRKDLQRFLGLNDSEEMVYIRNVRKPLNHNTHAQDLRPSESGCGGQHRHFQGKILVQLSSPICISLIFNCINSALIMHSMQKLYCFSSSLHML